MNRQVSGRSVGEYQADEQAGVTRLTWRDDNPSMGNVKRYLGTCKIQALGLNAMQ